MRLLTILLFLPLLSIGQTRPILFYDDCENSPTFIGTNCPNTNAPFSNGWTSRQGDNSTSSITYSTAFARSGTGSYAMTLLPSSNNNWQFMKAELAWNFLPAGSTLGVLGCNAAFSRPSMGLRWMAMSTYVPVSTTLPSDPITNIGFGFNTKSDPDYATTTYMVINSSRYRLVIQRVNADGSQVATGYDCGPVVKGEWVDWVLHRNFVQNNTGYVELYKNGERIYNIRNIGNWRVNGYSKEPYVQQGLYRFNSLSTPITIYYDEFRFGDSTITDVRDMMPAASTVPNQPPVTVINPAVVQTNTTSATVIATSTDIDGTITDRAWTYLSGPATPSVVGTTVDTLLASSLNVDGEYAFRLIVTDNGGLKDTAFVTIVKTTERSLIFSDDAEAVTTPPIGGQNANIQQYYAARSGSTTNTLQRSGERAREGLFSYKIGVRDTAATGWQFNYNELVHNFIPSTTAQGFTWQGVSVFMPEYMRGDSTPTIYGINALRFNQEEKAHWMDIRNGAWYFNHTLWSSSGVYLGVRSQLVGEVEYNKWTDWAVNRNYVNNSTGYIRVYRDKALVYTYTGINYSATNTRPEPYFHIGIGKPAFDSSANNNKDSAYAFFDNITFGGSAANIDLISPNQAPRVLIDPIPDTNADTIQLGALVTDIDGTIDSVKWVQLAGPTATLIGAGDTILAVLPDTGNYRFQAIATDNKEAVGQSQVTVRKFEDYVNTPPTVTLPNGILYKGIDTVTVTAVGADAEGSVTYQWFMDDSPGNATPVLTGANTATVTITNHKPGNYRLKVIVTDEDGASAEGVYIYQYRPIPPFSFIYSGQVIIKYR